MPEPTDDLLVTADVITYFGLWTGPNFAAPGHAHPLSISAAIYRAVTGTTPRVFRTSEDASLRLITANARVMAAIRHLSACLDTQPPHDPDTGRDDHLEHIETYTSRPAPHSTQPPSEGEVLGRILRAAQTPTAAGCIPAQRAAA